MITPVLALTRAEAEAQLVSRAWKDAEFRALLLENPRAAIAEELGIVVPDGISVSILQEDIGHVYIVLPPGPEGGVGGFELTDDTLEEIVGKPRKNPLPTPTPTPLPTPTPGTPKPTPGCTTIGNQTTIEI
jgi:hypothetical protein